MKNYRLNWHPLKCKCVLILQSPPFFFLSWNSIWNFCVSRDVTVITSVLLISVLCLEVLISYFSCNEYSANEACLFSWLDVKCPLINGPVNSRSWYHTTKAQVKKCHFLSWLSKPFWCTRFVHLPGVPGISFGVWLIIRKGTLKQIIEFFNSIEIISFVQIMYFICGGVFFFLFPSIVSLSAELLPNHWNQCIDQYKQH